MRLVSWIDLEREKHTQADLNTIETSLVYGVIRGRSIFLDVFLDLLDCERTRRRHIGGHRNSAGANIVVAVGLDDIGERGATESPELQVDE